MRVEISRALPEHIGAVAARVRQADRVELHLAACELPEETLQRALAASSLAWTGMIDGVPVCMFGVSPGVILGDVGHPWMVGTDLVDRYPRTFLRRCKGCVKEMLAAYSTLENFAHEENTRALQWLIWLGFKVAMPGERMGPFGARFCRFEMRRNGQ